MKLTLTIYSYLWNTIFYPPTFFQYRHDDLDYIAILSGTKDASLT